MDAITASWPPLAELVEYLYESKERPICNIWHAALAQWLWPSAADPKDVAVTFRWMLNARDTCTVRC